MPEFVAGQSGTFEKKLSEDGSKRSESDGKHVPESRSGRSRRARKLTLYLDMFRGRGSQAGILPEAYDWGLAFLMREAISSHSGDSHSPKGQKRLRRTQTKHAETVHENMYRSRSEMGACGADSHVGTEQNSTELPCKRN